MKIFIYPTNSLILSDLVERFGIIAENDGTFTAHAGISYRKNFKTLQGAKGQMKKWRKRNWYHTSLKACRFMASADFKKTIEETETTETEQADAAQRKEEKTWSVSTRS